jgi:flagellar biosynthetic protein FliR
MTQSMLLTAELSGWIALVMIIMARLSFVVFLMPGIGEQTVPVRARIGLLIAFATALAAANVITPPVMDSLPGFFLILGLEATVGLFLGVLLRLSIWILSITGTLIAQVVGFSQMLGIALETEAQAITANIMAMAGAALLLTMDYHVSVFVRFTQLYSEIPVGMISGIDPMFLARSAFGGFAFGVLLAWPFVAVNLLYNICLGFINRALPSLMVAFVGAPFIVGAGMLLLAVSVSTILMVWMDRIPSLIGWL